MPDPRITAARPERRRRAERRHDATGLAVQPRAGLAGAAAAPYPAKAAIGAAIGAPIAAAERDGAR
ncbi:hypothetical protein RSM1_13475 [Methylobacterium radiotolerans]|nr:hypothetical protein RSM1_13475 [Methylobacterium radiotolerans]